MFVETSCSSKNANVEAGSDTRFIIVCRTRLLVLKTFAVFVEKALVIQAFMLLLFS